MMRTRRHHNTDGRKQIKAGATRKQVKAIAKRIKVPYLAPDKLRGEKGRE